MIIKISNGRAGKMKRRKKMYLLFLFTAIGSLIYTIVNKPVFR